MLAHRQGPQRHGLCGESEEDYAQYLSSKCAPGVPFDGDSPPNVEVQRFETTLNGHDAIIGRPVQADEDRITSRGPPRGVLGLGLVLRLPHRQARLSAPRSFFCPQRYPSVCLYLDRPRQPPVPPRAQAQRLSVPKKLLAGYHATAFQAVSRISDPRPTSRASNGTGSDNATPSASSKLPTTAYLAHTSDSPSCYSTCPCPCSPSCRPSLSFGTAYGSECPLHALPQSLCRRVKRTWPWYLTSYAVRMHLLGCQSAAASAVRRQSDKSACNARNRAPPPDERSSCTLRRRSRLEASCIISRHALSSPSPLCLQPPSHHVCQCVRCRRILRGSDERGRSWSRWEYHSGSQRPRRHLGFHPGWHRHHHVRRPTLSTGWLTPSRTRLRDGMSYER
jgi:hypothetical protein